MPIIGTKPGDRFMFDVRDPFRDISFGGPLATRPVFSNEWTPFSNKKIDWKETSEAYVLKVNLPDLQKDEVKVEVEDDNILCLRGECNIETEKKNDQWHQVKRSSGKFLRRFRLSEDAEANKMKMHIENGLLTVTIPKGKGLTKRSKTIPIV